MTEVKGIGRRRTQLLDDLRNRIWYWEIKKEAEDQKDGKDSLSCEHKKEMYVFHTPMDLLTICILNNNNNKARNRSGIFISVVIKFL